jgi:plastocyanin
MRAGGLALLVCALAVGLGMARRAEHGTSHRHEIEMRSVSFLPSEIVAAVGDTIGWRNGDIVRHNAVRPGAFESEDLKPGERFEWVPADTGTFTYRCTIHARMRGKVVVK